MDKKTQTSGVKNLELYVPQEHKTRHAIRRKIDEYFFETELLPPVSYETLFNLASEFIEINNWDKKYHAFVMVCCGNSVWRKIVAAVPYHRRILLLPECLKNSLLCKAEHDNLGLLCHECGNCTICDFLQEAENLGYITLVTEGTTIASKLVEEGKVDAIIGIGCLESLQKIFASVYKYSVPGIGIPLLTCGCKDTVADSAWIKEELHRYYENQKIRLLNFNVLKSKLSAIFDEENIAYLFDKKNQTETERIAIQSILNGGQRLRPLLAMLTYQAFCLMPEKDTLNRIALSLECFHKASLIHDDIEDNDDLRYGKNTVHVDYGIPIAINTGDFLIGEGYRLITESNLPLQNIRESIRVLAESHRALTIGQGTELLATKQNQILPVNDMLFVFDKKTAAAFKAAILLGAIVGNADKDSLVILENFSNYIGIGYQIKDDLSDYSGKKGDIVNRKFSLLLSMLVEKLSDDEKIILDEIFLKKDNEGIIYLIQKFKVHEDAESLLKIYINKAKNELDNLENLGLKIALHNFIGKVFKDYL